MKTNKVPHLLMALTGLTSMASTGVQAQALEEVIVTATKRSVGLQDVPVSISVVSGDKIEKFGLSELEELSSYIPNLHIGKAVGSEQIFLRGIGSGNNGGFEQSVGTFVDGVYYGRARSSRAAFLDIERVEVLKGPQSTLFGKNTIAGAINITSGQPTQDFNGYLQGTYETELNAQGLTGMVNGALTDSISGRFIFKTYERDGWMENIFPGGAPDGPSLDTETYRAALAWDATDDLSVKLKVEHGKYGTVGSNSKITIAPPSAMSLFSYNDPNFYKTVGFNNLLDQSGGFPGRPIEDNSDNTIAQLTVEYQLGEYNIRSITASTQYDFYKCNDVEYGPIEFINQCFEEDHKQLSQEFLVTSPQYGPLTYIAGIYYQKEDLSKFGDIAWAWSGLPPVEDIILGSAGLGDAPSGTIDAFLGGTFQQNSETTSAFVEFTWHLSDSFRTIAGIRYSKDKKDADKKNYVTSMYDDAIVSDAYLAGIYDALNIWTSYEYNNLVIEEEHVTGSLNFQADLSEDVMAYLNFSTGYKAGGFDSANTADLSRTFEPETVKSMELGMKMEFWEGRARLNMAAFYSDYEDVQISSFVSTGAIVGNAAESEVKGLEADFEVAVTDKLNINGAISLLDATFKSFPDAACTVTQQLDYSGTGNCTQDLSGASLQFAPDVSGNLGINYTVLNTNAVEVNISTDILYTDDVLVGLDGDPNVIQDAYTKINARMSVMSNDGKWSLALVGKNLTDKTTFSFGNDATLSGTGLGFENSYYHIIDMPRTYEFQARYNF